MPHAGDAEVEARQRPDGARRGHPGFFDLLHAGKRSVVLDWPREAECLRRLVAQADVVVEASRPRALRQLGIEAREVLAERPGRTWLSITGYGRHAPFDQWVGFGDDTAVAGGLYCGTEKDMRFCADALADPLTGAHAALAVWLSQRRGGGELVSLSLADVAAHTFRAGRPRGEVCEGPRGWRVVVDGRAAEVAQPRRRPSGRAPAFGQHTRTVLQQ